MDFKPRGRFFIPNMGNEEPTSPGRRSTRSWVSRRTQGRNTECTDPPSRFSKRVTPPGFQNPISSLSWATETGLAYSKVFTSPIHPNRDFTTAPLFKTGHAQGLTNGGPPVPKLPKASSPQFQTPQSLHPQTKLRVEKGPVTEKNKTSENSVEERKDHRRSHHTTQFPEVRATNPVVKARGGVHTKQRRTKQRSGHTHYQSGFKINENKRNKTH